MGPLTVHRQIFTVAQTAIRSHIEVALDIAGHLAPQIAFDLVALVHDLADLGRIIIGQIIGLEIQRDPGLAENFARRAAPDAVDVSQGHFHSLAFG